MTAESRATTSAADAADAPIPYMRRTRDYYEALGYGAPYVWAHYTHVPFAALAKPLSECRVALVTTAAPHQPGKGDQGPGAPYNAAVKFYAAYSGDTSIDHDLHIAHVAIDRKHTTAEDLGTYFPPRALRDAAKAGRIGAPTARFHGMPTHRSQSTTLDVDCPELVARCRDDGADVAILVPNCPVCHQTLSLAVRALEAQGIATVVTGMREGRRRARRRCALPVLRFSAGQRRRASERSCVPGAHDGIGARPSRACARGAHDARQIVPARD